jgi:predicted porin
MQKKIIAAAVAGALAIPAVAAYAQSSTVQIYGRITYEYGNIHSAGNIKDTDYADTPGGSAIGFRGEEKLGGGLSAWFQCESSADVRGMDQTGFCTRNSAVGFRGGFGNVFFGRWDTPFKRALNVGTVGAEETGILGMSFLPFGGSGGSDATNSADGPQRQRWKRREAGLTYYETPVFGGFQAMGAFSTGNFAADQAVHDNPTLDPDAHNAKPRVWSLGVTWTAGPFGIGAGYEMHKQFNAHSGPILRGGDDTGWGVSAAYTFGPVKIGATYLDTEYETLAGQEAKRKTWTVGVDWRIAGPHSIQAQYANAGDVKGNSTVGVAQGANGGLDPSGGGTGGDAWSISYAYALSKRTRFKVGYVYVDPDSNATTFRIGNSARPVLPSAAAHAGSSSSGYAFHISHSF